MGGDIFPKMEQIPKFHNPIVALINEITNVHNGKNMYIFPKVTEN